MATAQELVGLLAGRGLTLGTCESLTGGALAAAITEVPGASAVFRGGLVTYASDLKTSLAGVDAEQVRRHGVINAETARAMAVGARDVLGVDLAVACTGVAGPEPQDGAAVGTVWLALADRNGVVDQLLQLDGNRAAIRARTVKLAMALVREKFLQE